MLNHKLTFQNENDGFIKRNIILLMEKIMGVNKLNDLLYQIRLRGGYSNIGSGLVRFFKWEMKGVDTHFLTEDLKKGPLLIVANHPFGLPDGAMIAEVMKKYLGREDYKFFVGGVVTKIFPELKESGFTVTNLKKDSSTKTENIRTLISARNHLKKGGMIIMFPAGEVSGVRFKSEKGILKVCDFKWDESFHSLAKSSKATIMPVHLRGHNSFIFLFWRFFGKMIGRMCLFREFVKLPPGKVFVTFRRGLPFLEHGSIPTKHLIRFVRTQIFKKN
mgnify:CR=1 FL=1